MTERQQELHDAIALAVDETGLCGMEGGEGLRAFAERIEVSRIAMDSLCDAVDKWSARGVVTLQLFNWDDEQFGEVKLHLSASGHGGGSEIAIDSLLISPSMH